MADDFKAQDFQEAVRDILKDYRKEYLALGNALVERILEKLKDGVPVIKAVEDAVKEAGFLGANAKAVSNVLFLAACAGYGILPKFVTTASEEEIKHKLMSMPWTGDKMKLSERLHSLKVRQNVIFAISSAMKQAKTVAQMAMDIYDGYNSGQGVLDQAVLRKDLNKVLQMARQAVQGDEAILGELRKKALKIQQYTRSMKTKPLQAAYHEFLDACTANELSETAIERAARTAIEETTRYQAERMARTEAARAWFDGYVAAREEDDDVWGYRWRLSSRHYRCPFDQCDVCANMNVGYGKGIYPKNKVPSIPRHPHCMCMLEDVFSWEQDGEEIKPEGAREYIDSLEEKQKEALFGKDGRKAYEAGGDWQKLLRGWDGFRKPKSRLGSDDFKFDLQLFGAKNPLPNLEKAVIPSEKIFKYTLDKEHKTGGPKAIAFEKALGYNISNGSELIANIRQCLPALDCTTIRKTRFGTQYSGDVMMRGPNGKTAKVRIAWQIDYGEEVPHLTSIYVNS